MANSKGDVWFDGVADMLNGLREAGLQLAVATGKSRKGLDRVLAQTQSQALFVTTRAASETKSEPHPLMLEEILAETGVSAERAIMVGDTSYDLEMARTIAMPRIGVSYGCIHLKRSDNINLWPSRMMCRACSSIYYNMLTLNK